MSKAAGGYMDLLQATFGVGCDNYGDGTRLFNVGVGYKEGQSTLLATTTIPVEGHNSIFVFDVKLAKSRMDPWQWESIDSDQVEVQCTKGEANNVRFVLKAGENAACSQKQRCSRRIEEKEEPVRAVELGAGSTGAGDRQGGRTMY